MKWEWSNYQEDIFKFVESGSGHGIIEAVAGGAKCLGKGTPVLKYDGAVVPVEELKAGDLLMGPDSEPRQILSTDSGRGPLFRVNPTKGDSWICNDAHILTLMGTNRKMGIIQDISVLDYLDLISKKPSAQKDWKLYRTGVAFAPKDLEIDPYLIGLWIGDGAKNAPIITSADREVIDYCRSVASTYGLEAIVTPEKSKAYRIRFRVGERGKAHRGTPHLFRRWIKKHSPDGKIIPRDYLINSEDNRKKLLAGLIDSDGHYHNGHYQLTTVDFKLSEQYLFLARSLGLAAYCVPKKAAIKSLNYETICYPVTISGCLDDIPTRLKRKQATVRKQIKRTYVTGFELQPIGDGDFYGFTLNRDGRFLLGDFTVTHNTTALLECLNYIPPDKTWLLAAFNKRIAEELKRRAPSSFNGDVKTLHALGLRALGKRIKNIKVEQNKNNILLNKIVGKNKKLWDLKSQISKTVDLCKGYLIDGAEYIDVIMDNHSVDTCEIDRDQFINFVQKTLEAARESTHMVDFSDMIWMPHVFNLPVQKYNYVFCDEAQDMNNAQTQLVLKACKRNGRILAFGDRAQAIYIFRGASLNSMDKIKDKLNATELPLSVTYRCPTSVVKEAQKFVPHIEARPNAPEGSVQNISKKEMLKLAKPGCFILSRVNAPLVGLALGFIRNSIPAMIQGRDIGQNLLTLIKKSRKKTLDAFLNWLATWESKEVARLQKKRADTDPITDKASCLRALANACHNLDEMKRKIQILFEDTDDNGKIVLSSVHKAKGLERDDVFMLLNTFRTFSQEERNIYYVGITRSKSNLYYVS